MSSRLRGDSDTALVIIDMQMEMQPRIDAGRPHVHPEAPDRIAVLADAFRRNRRPVIHIRHAAADSAASLHPDAPGYPPMACAVERPGEAVFVKRSSSAFATTGLETHLRRQGITHIHVVGAVAGFCVASTVRAASDLGFGVTVVVRSGNRVRPALRGVGGRGDLRRHHGVAGGGLCRGGRE